MLLFARVALSAPLATVPAPVIEAAAYKDALGSRIVAGDFDADGLDDLAVGSHGDDTAASGAGAVFIVLGADGLAWTSTTLYGDAANDAFGRGLAAGDFNGDGADDLAVSAPYASPGGLAAAGEVYLYSGASRLTTVAGTADGQLTGWGLDNAGDTDGDGYDDVIASLPGYLLSSGDPVGAAVVWGGAAAGLDATPLAALVGTEAYGEFGSAVAGVGDTDGDGYDDVVVGASWAASWAGNAYLFPGSGAGPASAAAVTMTGSSDEYLGTGATRLGDVNGDGYDDFSVWGQGASLGVWMGGAGGPASAADLSLDIATCGANTGSLLRPMGDVDADGYDDVVMIVACDDGGTPEWADLGTRLDLFLGGASPSPDPAWTFPYTGDDAAALDLDADGWLDLAFGVDTGGARVGGAVQVVLGMTDADGDAHGTGGFWASEPDCDDADAETYPGAPEVDGDGLDSDCDGADDATVSTYSRTCPTFATLAEARELADDPGGAFDGADTAAQALWTSLAGLDCTFASRRDSMSDCTLAGDGVEAWAAELWTSEEDMVFTTDTLRLFADIEDDPSADPSSARFLYRYEVVEAVSATTDTSWESGSVGSTTWADGSVTTFDVTRSGSTVSDFGYRSSSTGWAGVVDGCALELSESEWRYGSDGSYSAALTDGSASLTVVGGASTEVCGVRMSKDHGYATFGAWEGLVDLDTWEALPGDSDADGWPASEGDCNDADVSVHPCAAEIVDDGIDNDCDGTGELDADGDGVGYTTDCDDADAGAYPGAVETVGDGVDQDCDGVDDCYADADGDGYTDGSTLLGVDLACTGALVSAVSLDCDDSDAAVSPSAVEACGGGDEDCDGLTDDADASVDAAGLLVWYADADGDGVGGTSTTLACAQPSGHTAKDGDCDDSNPLVNPEATEVCDGSALDEDCDGLPDEADPDLDLGSAIVVYEDADGDAHGAGVGQWACELPVGYALEAGDCDESDATVNPSASEVCGGADEDCDTLLDDDDPSLDATTTIAVYEDDDGDGYGAGAALAACALTPGHALIDGDCADRDDDINPGATERCDATDDDEDCDGKVDDDDSSTAADSQTVTYVDADGDGYGDPATAAGACEPPTDHVRNGEDCDDTDASANPRGREVPDDSIDQDCDGEDLTTPAPDTGDSGDTGGSGADDSGNDTAAEPAHPVEPGDTSAGSAAPPCGCATGAGGALLPALLGSVVALRRRRRGTGAVSRGDRSGR